MVLGVFWGTLGSLKMSIWCRRNIHFHFFDPRKCDLEIGPRKSQTKVSFWKDFGLHFGDFCLPKRVQKSGRKQISKQSENSLAKSDFGAGLAERAEPGERYREGLRRQKLTDFWEKDFGKEFLTSHIL